MFSAELESVGLEINRPKGSFYIWMKVPEGFSSEEFMNYLVDEARVIVALGDGFGSLGEGYVRIGLTQSNDNLQKAARRIAQLAPFSLPLWDKIQIIN